MWCEPRNNPNRSHVRLIGMKSCSIRALRVITLLVPLCSPLLGQEKTKSVAVTIEVTDQTGTGVQHAEVRVVPSPDSASTKLETDTKGKLLLDLKPGGYALFVA